MKVTEGKPRFNQLKERFGGFNLFFISGLVAFIIYSSFQTRLLPNTYSANETIGNVTSEVSKVRYSPNDFVPNKNFDLGVAFAISSGIIFIAFLLTKKEKVGSRVKIGQAINIAEAYLRTHPEYKNHKLQLSSKLRFKQIDDSSKIPDDWVIPFEFEDREEGISYLTVLVSPITGDVEGTIKMQKEFDGRDVCQNCGDFYDVKYILSDNLSRMGDLFNKIKK